MKGIDLNEDIKYLSASFRYFKNNEKHISRLCSCDVLVLVFSGTLRFFENGKAIEVKAGEYYIQKKGSLHTGDMVSDSPKYLYIHFNGVWCDSENALYYRGKYDYHVLRSLMEKMDKLGHSDQNLIHKKAVMYNIFSQLAQKSEIVTRTDDIARYISENYQLENTLQDLSKIFNYSKNQIINLFKKEFKITPIQYLLRVRIENVKRLLVITSKSAEEISYECGFSDYSHLYKCFKKNCKCSPKEWRKKNQLM